MVDFKNIQQVGKPTYTDKVYIENNAYQRIHREEFPERRVFVLMGHTECAPAGYSTFIEAAIPVWDITFSQAVPTWNNHVWNDVFQEIKQYYEKYVIVGWALDIKGMPPRVTSELEAVHREQFGGAHQLLLMMDSLEQEELFYQSRGGHLCPKEGFYIYYNPECHKVIPEYVWNEKVSIQKTDAEEEPVQAAPKGKPVAHYRDIVYGENKETAHDSGKWVGAVAMFAAIALLFAILGTGIYQGRFSLNGVQQVVESMSSRVDTQKEESQEHVQENSQINEETQMPETQGGVEEIQSILKELEAAGEDETIPVEDVPGGEIIHK